MSVAALIADMVRAGVDPELIGRTAALLAERETVTVKDEQAERRREKDRERKAFRRIPQNSADSADAPPFLPPLVSPTPPSELPPIIPPISSLRSDSAGTPAQEASLASQGEEKPAAAKREITSAEYAERRLRALGCDQNQIDEWKIVRKSKRAPLTDTAVIALAREAERANISIPDAVTLCIERNWQSFRAEFLTNTQNQQTNGHRNGY